MLALPNNPLVGIISFVLLVFASWCVGEGGEILGRKYDASIIGGLIIAWLNTSPETIFFIVALQSNNPRFAVGAVSGSSIVVCTIALGTCVYIGAKTCRAMCFELQPAVKRQALILGISVIFPLLLSIVGFHIVLGFLGVAAYLAFLVYSLVKKNPDIHSSSVQLTHMPDIEFGSKTIQNEDNNKRTRSKGDSESETTLESDEKDADVPVWKGIVYLLVGGLLIGLFSESFIRSVVFTAKSLNVNAILLAFFLAPVASEMPEILESISLSRKGNIQNINIAYSNLIGGTITKTTLLLGIFCFYGVGKHFKWESPNYSISLLLLILCGSGASATGYFFNKLTKWNGIFLFTLFVFTAFVQYYFNSTFVDV
jgi:Ca2+/Na+ antiporter